MFKNTKAFSGFSVNDIQKAKEFYGQILGLGVGQLPMDSLELQIAGGTKILIYAKSDHTPASFTILNFPVDDLETAVEQLKTRGVRFESYEDPIKTDEKGIHREPGAPDIAWFRDPAGNVLSVIEEKPM